jgi:hypothetical protein
VSVPCSPTPAGPRVPGHCGIATRPSVSLTTSAPANSTLSGLNRTARSLAVYASQRRLPGRHARLAPGCWPALPDGVGYPQGPDERFPLSLPPFPSFSWRTKLPLIWCIRLVLLQQPLGLNSRRIMVYGRLRVSSLLADAPHSSRLALFGLGRVRSHRKPGVAGGPLVLGLHDPTVAYQLLSSVNLRRTRQRLPLRRERLVAWGRE